MKDLVPNSAPFNPPAAPTSETASSAVAALSRAAVEARYVMALQRPRNPDQARLNLLKRTRNPEFAKSAGFALPRGNKTIAGPSIRLLEAAAGMWGNILCESTVLFDAPLFKIIRVTVSDLETNNSESREITVAKTVERRKLREGQQSLGQRLNSFGDTVYIVEATDDEQNASDNRAVAKAKRALLEHILPGDYVHEAYQASLATAAEKDAQDPEAARKRMLDSFAAAGVVPADLAKLLGHPTTTISVVEMTTLRGVYQAITKEGRTFAEILAEKEADADDDRPQDAKPVPHVDVTAQKSALHQIADLRMKLGDVAYRSALQVEGIGTSESIEKAPPEVVASLLQTLQEMDTQGSRQ